jgi:hypothetical protein
MLFKELIPVVVLGPHAHARLGNQLVRFVAIGLFKVWCSISLAPVVELALNSAHVLFPNLANSRFEFVKLVCLWDQRLVNSELTQFLGGSGPGRFDVASCLCLSWRVVVYIFQVIILYFKLIVEFYELWQILTVLIKVSPCFLGHLELFFQQLNGSLLLDSHIVRWGELVDCHSTIWLESLLCFLRGPNRCVPCCMTVHIGKTFWNVIIFLFFFWYFL